MRLSQDLKRSIPSYATLLRSARSGVTPKTSIASFATRAQPLVPEVSDISEPCWHYNSQACTVSCVVCAGDDGLKTVWATANTTMANACDVVVGECSAEHKLTACFIVIRIFAGDRTVFNYCTEKTSCGFITQSTVTVVEIALESVCEDVGCTGSCLIFAYRVCELRVHDGKVRSQACTWVAALLGRCALHRQLLPWMCCSRCLRRRLCGWSLRRDGLCIQHPWRTYPTSYRRT